MQIAATLGCALNGIAAVQCVFVGINEKASVVIKGVGACYASFVDCDQVRRTKRLRPRAADQDLLDRAIAKAELANRGIADIGEVFIAHGQLHIEIVQNGNAELEERGRDVAVAFTVRGWRGVRNVRNEWESVP